MRPVLSHETDVTVTMRIDKENIDGLIRRNFICGLSRRHHTEHRYGAILMCSKSLKYAGNPGYTKINDMHYAHAVHVTLAHKSDSYLFMNNHFLGSFVSNCSARMKLICLRLSFMYRTNLHYIIWGKSVSCIKDTKIN